MKYKYSILLALFSVFFFVSSCELIDTQDEPNADYQIKGTVTDSITNATLANIRVVITRPDDARKKNDTVFTNNSGKYSFSFNDNFLFEPNFTLRFEDVSSSEPVYEPRQIYVFFTSADWVDEGDDFNYYGRAQKTVNVKMLKSGI